MTPFINAKSKNYQTARRNSYFINDAGGNPEVIRWWNGKASPVDFTNEEAARWYCELLQASKLKNGLKSFKFDAGETTYLPDSGLEFASAPDKNPGAYTKLYASAAYCAGGVAMEMRSAWKNQWMPTFTRIMDKGSSWDLFRSLKTVIPTVLTFGMIGYPFVIPDMIGGNSLPGRQEKPDRELYIRWLQLTAFLPVMQFSIAPWQYDEQVNDLGRRFVEIHETIVYPEIIRASERYVAGEMVLPAAPLWFEEDFSRLDSPSFEISDQFVVGDRYMIAPILDQGQTERDIYFPGSADVVWKDKMKEDCDVTGDDSCFVRGGSWIKNYQVSLSEISWWEKM